MSDRCNKCKHFLLEEKFCREHHRTAHSRDHVCREFKKPDKPDAQTPKETPDQPNNQ